MSLETWNKSIFANFLTNERTFSHNTCFRFVLFSTNQISRRSDKWQAESSNLSFRSHTFIPYTSLDLQWIFLTFKASTFIIIYFSVFTLCLALVTVGLLVPSLELIVHAFAITSPCQTLSKLFVLVYLAISFLSTFMTASYFMMFLPVVL